MLPSRAGLAHVALLVAVNGCGTPRIAAGTAQRSLSLPATDRQAFAATGMRLGKEETRLAAIRKVGFRYGITDRLDYLAPLGMSYLLLDRERFQLAGSVWLGYMSFPSVDEFAVRPSLAITVRAAATPSTAILVTAHSSPYVSSAHVRFPFGVSSAFVWDATRWLSLALTGELASQLRTTGGFSPLTYRLGGFANDGYGPISNIVLHLHREIDVQLAVGWKHSQSPTSATWGSIGLDWHFGTADRSPPTRAEEANPK